MKTTMLAHDVAMVSGLLTLAAALAAALTAPVAALAAGANLPPAPKLTDEPIQYLDRLYQDAFVDHDGRAWFLVPGIGLGEAASDAAFDHLVCPDLPGKVIEIPVNNIPIGFDSKGRFWDITRYGLGCTDLATGEFSERDVAPGTDPDRLAKPNPNYPDYVQGFARVMLEHSSGRLYFVDSYGLHVLDGGTWSYQLFDPGIKWLCARGESAKIAECPDGSVAVWGKVGLWTHDGKSWRRHSSAPYEFAPLSDGQCLVMIEANGMGRVARLSLKDDKPADPPARDPLTTRWPSFKHALTLPHGASLIEGYDTALSRFLLAMVTPAGEAVALPPDAELRFEHRNVLRPAPRLPDGRVVLPTRPLYTWDGQKVAPLFLSPLAVSGVCFGCDKRGRVVLSADDQEIYDSYRRLAVISRGALAARPSLPVEVFGSVSAATLDSAGQVWAKLLDQPFVSCRANRQWRHFPLPEGLGARQKYTPAPDFRLQPLGDGCMAAEVTRMGACFFDGGRWTGYESPRALIEANADRLRKVIDNGRAMEYGSALLSLDAAGRIWTTDMSGPAGAPPPGMSVYDGQQWLTLDGSFMMSPDGASCVRQTRYGVAILDTAPWPPKQITAMPRDVDSPFARAAVRFDRRKRFIAQNQYQSPAWLWDGASWTKLPVVGNCVLSDSAGRLWFSSHFNQLAVVGADGKVGPVYEHPARNKGPVIEQAPGTYWCAASDGLMQLGVVDRGGKPVVVVHKQYRDIVPQGNVQRLFFDADGALWIVSDRLARVEVPPASAAQGRQ